MNNFKKFGDFYVAKSGSDSNAGNTPDAPFASVSAAIYAANNAGGSKNIIIGTGTYEESFADTGNTLLADGIVVFKGNGSNTLQVRQITGTAGSYVTIQDYASFFGYQLVFKYVKIINVASFSFNISAGQADFENCIFINTTLQAVGGGFSTLFNKCVFVNVNSNACITNLTNSYINGASTLRLLQNENLNYNNLMGTVYVYGDTTAYTYTTLLAAYPALCAGSFNQTPQFNNVQKEDFTLQAISPHIGAASDGDNIGGTQYGVSYACGINSAITNNNAANNVWQAANGAVINNLTLNGQDYTITSGNSGDIKSAPMFLSSNIQALNAVGYLGFKLFNKSQPAGSATNNNVPDHTPFYSGDTTGGLTPDRLTFLLRTSTKATIPTQESDWDNNGYTAVAGTWLEIPWEEAPAVDANSKGNGDPSFNLSSSQPVTGMWAQMWVYLTDLYENTTPVLD